MKRAQQVLAAVAALTDQREVDAIEISLLTTLQDFLVADELAIYHRGREGQPEFAIALRGDTVLRCESEHATAAAYVASYSVFSQKHAAQGYLQVSRQQPLSADESALLNGLLRVYDNYASVLYQSQTDRLTGLLNRHTFDMQFERALKRIRSHYAKSAGSDARRRRPDGEGEFWMGAIDIDHFKRINDTFGHLYGDEVLLIVAQLMRSTFRQDDLIYRFGGEEFVAIVFVESTSDAALVFERIRKTIESYPFPRIGQVTASIGVAAIQASSAPVELLGSADRALYYAKNNGRNRVCFYDDLVESRQIVEPPSGGITYF